MTGTWRTILPLLLSLAMAPATAQTLRIGLSAEPSSIDPMFSNITPNNLVRAHIFDRLLHIDADGRLIPDLAEHWHPVGDTVWEFRLRRGVRFHDGSALTSDDVAFSLDRAGKVANSPSSFAMFVRGIQQIEVTGPRGFRIHTATADAYVPRDMANIAIMSRHAAMGHTTQDFNAGIGVVGTGAYRFVSWHPGAPVVLTRNDAYWRKPAAWVTVELRPLTLAATREIALLTGDVDLIQAVPREDAERLSHDPGVAVIRDVPFGVSLLSMDQSSDNVTSATGNDGQPLGHNPFKDRRVRLAVSKAIDRAALVRGIMAGFAVPAAQMVPNGMFGASPNQRVEPYDPAGARALLAEAGYAEGFRLTLYAPLDGVANGAVAQVIAQMLARVGVKTAVEAPPLTVFFPRYARRELSFALFTWLSGEMSYALKPTLATADPVRGWGAMNRGGYSNPALDALLARAQGTLDDTRRGAILAEASEIAMTDLGIIPLFHPIALWGVRRPLVLDVSVPGQSLAANVHRERLE